MSSLLNIWQILEVKNKLRSVFCHVEDGYQNGWCLGSVARSGAKSSDNVRLTVPALPEISDSIFGYSLWVPCKFMVYTYIGKIFW